MNSQIEQVPMIIPTVMIPLAAISVGISVVASLIAGLFGIKLKTEGPKKFLELLLKPRILLSALVLNLAVWGGAQAWKWWANSPRLLMTIRSQASERSVPSDVNYVDAPRASTPSRGAQSGKWPKGIEQIWTHSQIGPVFSAPILSSGSLFVGSRKGLVSELEAESGKVIRSFYIGSPVTGGLVIWQNSLFATEGVHDLHHARVYRFDLKSGAFTGSFETAGHIETRPVLARHNGMSTLFVASGRDGLHAIDPATLKSRWHVNAGHSDGAALVDEGRVFLGTGREKENDRLNRSYALALDFHTGAELWKHELPASSWMSPARVGSDVCFPTGEIYFPSDHGQVACFRVADGEPTVAFSFDRPVASVPLEIDGDLVVTTVSGTVCRLDMTKRERRWCFEAKSGGTSFAGVTLDASLGLLLYPSLDQGLFLLDAETGQLALNWKPTEAEGAWKKTYASVRVTEKGWVVSDYESTVRVLRPVFAPSIGNQAANEAASEAQSMRQ